MSIKNLDEQQLIETRDVITRELRDEERLNHHALVDFKIAFELAIESIEKELFERKQLLLI